MINFSTLQSLTIPEGVVTQIADASGRVLWAVSGGKVILEVEKITSNTYAGETTYTDEQFILLDIYPKTNGTVKVTYGGLTKTVKDTSGAVIPNAQQVFFGTFNGVSDSVATPASGELTIEGSLAGFAVGTYTKSSDDKTSNNNYCGCVTAIVEYGITAMKGSAFHSCDKLTNAVLPSGLSHIPQAAFYHSGLTNVIIPETVIQISMNAFAYCENLKSITIPKNVKTMDSSIIDLSGVETVIMLASVPPTINTSLIDGSTPTVFSGAAYLTKIIVPKGCVDVYKTALGWSGQADRIVEAS